MPDQHDHGARWGSGSPPWVRDGRSDTGRRFRRGVLGVFVVVVVLVAALASIVASLASGTHPKPFITITVAALGVIGLIVTARWLWRAPRSIGALMDAADRVAGGDYATRVGDVPGRPYQRLAGAVGEVTNRPQDNQQRRRENTAGGRTSNPGVNSSPTSRTSFARRCRRSAAPPKGCSTACTPPTTSTCVRSSNAPTSWLGCSTTCARCRRSRPECSSYTGRRSTHGRRRPTP